MAGTSAAEAGHHSCHCIAAVKPLRHPKARKCLPSPSLEPEDIPLPISIHRKTGERSVGSGLSTLPLLVGQPNPVSLIAYGSQSELLQSLICGWLEPIKLDPIVTVLGHMNQINSWVANQLDVVRVQKVHNTSAPFWKHLRVIPVIDALAVWVRCVCHDSAPPVNLLEFLLVEFSGDAPQCPERLTGAR